MELESGRLREERHGGKFVGVTSTSLRCGVMWCGVEGSLAKNGGVDVDDPDYAQ